MEKDKVIKEFLRISTDLSELAKPLEQASITCFSYLKNFKHQAQINLSSQPQWIDDYYSLQLYKSSEYEGSPINYNEELSLWSSVNMDSSVIRHGKDYFNSDHGITLINKSEQGTEFYFFSGASDDLSMHNKLINNVNFLKHFVLYFKDKMSNELNALERDKCFIQKPYNAQNDYNLKITSDDVSLKVNRLHLNINNQEVRFSPRETECIRQLLKFKTAGQLAESMSVTIRTVECFIEQIKRKMNVYSKQELLEKLINLREFL
ncbi:helix-turn-helix transcriptional regulator [Legionella shakespearei]|uniref:Bacterial regulatory protein, luxR family n=1 Tax=Legionella shakespearei DSM 23087 TaxID=1122169 RepID=A0A0W0YI05_9GAMM|nr:helix-turn-helix transcriptional regulator [Legionella shakespearei]KTD56459.1 Bacterial regulatory protein, luxR family [Legionella shakespearei DSM 23087]